MKFFKWLYSPDIEPDKRTKTFVIENVLQLKRKERSICKPSAFSFPQDQLPPPWGSPTSISLTAFLFQWKPQCIMIQNFSICWEGLPGTNATAIKSVLNIPRNTNAFKLKDKKEVHSLSRSLFYILNSW